MIRRRPRRGTAQPKVYKDSPTGRACGPIYDVVHSTVTAVVAENAVEDFIRTLQSGRMVTVLNVEKKNLTGAGRGPGLRLRPGAGRPGQAPVRAPVHAGLDDARAEGADAARRSASAWA